MSQSDSHGRIARGGTEHDHGRARGGAAVTSDRITLTPCRVCRAGRRAPCVDSFGNEIDQYHQQRVVDSLRPVNHAAEATRLRAEAKGSR